MNNYKVVILAGGRGVRLSEETEHKPKPMIEIGSLPIIVHLIKIYSHFGFNDFIICLGYKGYLIKEYFRNYFIHESDVTFDMTTGQLQIHSQHVAPWKVTLVDTGPDTMTGGRLLRVKKYLEGQERFLFTYGDGLADINVLKLIQCHLENKREATVTAVCPPGRFGSLQIGKSNNVTRFIEKPAGDGGRINGGFFVFEKSIFNRLKDDSTILEADPLQGLAKEQQLTSFIHDGFWQPMDTLRDKVQLEELWKNNKAPWLFGA